MRVPVCGSVAILVIMAFCAWPLGEASAQARTGSSYTGASTGNRSSSGAFSGTTSGARATGGANILGNMGSFMGQTQSGANVLGSMGSALGSSGSLGGGMMGASTLGTSGAQAGRGANTGDPFASSRANPFQLGQFGGNNLGGNLNAGGRVGAGQRLNQGMNQGMNQFRAGGANTFGNQGFNNFGQMGTNLGRNGLNQGITTSPGFIIRAYFDNLTPGSMEATTTRLATASVNRFQSVLARSPRLANAGAIKCAMDGQTVVLTGTVNSESERRLAEMLLRLEPGVYDLRNELQVGRKEDPPPSPSLP